MVGPACAATGIPFTAAIVAMTVLLGIGRSGHVATMAYEVSNERVASAKLATVLCIRSPRRRSRLTANF